MTSSRHKSQEPDENREQEKPAPLLISLSGYALTGGAALLLLSLIEWLDLNASPSMPLDSLSARLFLFLYSSVNVLAGLVIGLLVGLFAHSLSFLREAAETVMAADGKVRARHKLLAGSSLAVAAAFVLNNQPNIHRYVTGLLREGEKIDSLRDPLLSREQLVSYLVVLVVLICCWAVWKMTFAAKTVRRILLRAWLSGVIILISAAYYVDSRVEVQHYEGTLHLSMYILNLTLAMALIGSIYFSSSVNLSRWQALTSRLRKAAILSSALILSSAVTFTFFHFGGSQALKAIVFYRTTQIKQSHKLIWWALDRDGDGYPALMGGGDAEEGRADVNPGQLEVIGDGVDNNCIGGDLTRQDVDDWKREQSLPQAASTLVHRFNIVYIFIDALRADHLGAYGYPRNVSPNIDKLAARSIVFENAFTPSPNTYEALPKFMQSSYFGPSLIDRYDGEIAYTDSQFGRLFDWMETSGRLKDTVIVIMADHGESMGERGVYKHSSQLYNEQTRVPAIIYVPNLEARRVADYVSTIDLGSTILHIAGLERPKGSVGVSLLPLMMGERLNYPPVYGEHTNKQESPYVAPEQNVHYETKKYMVITQDGYKLIYNRNFYSFELFDLKNDPGENTNLYDRLPEKAGELKRLLGRFVDVVTASRPRDADENQYLFDRFDEADDDE